MKNFLKKYKIYLAICIYFVIIGLLLFFVSRPMVSKINEKNNKIQEDLTNQEIKKDRISNLPATRNQFEMVNSQASKIEFLLNNGNVVNLIEKLEKISEETGNNIKIELSEDRNDSKKPAQTKKASDKKEIIADNLPSDVYIKMNISLKGGYGNFLDFLRKLENSDYYSDVVSFKITNYQKSEASSNNNPFKENSAGTEENIDNKNNILSTLGVIFYLEKK